METINWRIREGRPYFDEQEWSRVHCDIDAKEPGQLTGADVHGDAGCEAAHVWRKKCF